MKQLKLMDLLKEEKTPSWNELVDMVNKEIDKKPYQVDPDGDKIFYAKKIARQYKVKFQDILARIGRPSGILNRPVWDMNGNIIPYQKWKNTGGIL